MNKNLKFNFNDKLNESDTENQTFGCRQNNPDICSSNGVENICAFASADRICKKPSRAWKKQYAKLREDKKSEKI